MPPHASIPSPTGTTLEIAIAEDIWVANPIGRLARQVGGLATLQQLDDAALPDEPFDWTSVDDQDAPYVEEVLHLTDEYCDEWLDTEYRTIARRILARVASRDPAPFRRGGSTRTCAAALVWLVLRANCAVGRGTRRRASWIWSSFRVSSCTDRAHGLRRAAGLIPVLASDDDCLFWDNELPLGTSTLLHSRVRRSLIDQRDRLEETAKEALAQRAARRPFTDLGNGKVDVRARPTSALCACKGVAEDNGRAMVILGFGESDDDAEMFALSVPGAHDLVAMLQRALSMPLPQVPR